MVTYSLQKSDSSDVKVSAGEESAAGKLAPTEGWDDFKTAKLGTLAIRDKGDMQVVLSSPMEPGLRIINLRAVELVPVSK